VKSSIFDSEDKIMAWSAIDPTHLMTLNGLTERQIANLAPLDHENFSQDFLALANNASLDYGLLSNIIDENSLDYFRDLDNTVTDYIAPKIESHDISLNNVYPFYTEWYDEKYATKFGQETGHPEFEIDETIEMDKWRKCYQMINTDNLSREEMINYLDKETAYRKNELEEFPDNELKATYRSVYNSRLGGLGNS
jgi:hypothetical protein